MNIEEVLGRLLNAEDVAVGVEAGADEIQDAEDVLGVRFPADFRAYLERVGWMRVEGEEISGLGADVPPYLHLVRETLAERTQFQPYIPQRLLPIHNDGFGNHDCIDLEGGTELVRPIVFWNHELGADQEPELVAPGFADWLAQLSTED